jgi:hypothetical protein
MNFASARAALITGNPRDIADAIVGTSLWRCIDIAVFGAARKTS